MSDPSEKREELVPSEPAPGAADAPAASVPLPPSQATDISPRVPGPEGAPLAADAPPRRKRRKRRRRRRHGPPPGS
jgi:hypothetical protein